MESITLLCITWLILLTAHALAQGGWTYVDLGPAGAVPRTPMASPAVSRWARHFGGEPALHAACGTGRRQAGWTSTPAGAARRKPWPSPAASRWAEPLSQARPPATLTPVCGAGRRQAGWTLTPPGRPVGSIRRLRRPAGGLACC